RIIGIKTNIPFLKIVDLHEDFASGAYTTIFIDNSPQLFEFPIRRDRGTKLLTYISDMTINGVDGVPKKKKLIFTKIIKPDINILEEVPEGTKQILDKHGPEYLSKWLKEQPNTLLTDTTFRDAHQSLLATRVRTHDLVGIADETARLLPDLFSM